MSITQQEISKYVEANINSFHNNRLDKLKSLDFNSVLTRKNPYLFKAKNILTAHDLVKGLMDSYLSSQEEGVFGLFLEDLAIFICSKIYGGIKSKVIGIDLEFEKDNIYYYVSIKSGPNWANSDQINRMKQNFKNAKDNHQISSNLNIVCVNGCCYGKDNKPDKKEYLKLCGQRFWEFVSGIPNLYIDIIEPLGYKAKEKNEEFLSQYAKTINIFTQKFSQEYCSDGSINWQKILELNSGKNKLIRCKTNLREINLNCPPFSDAEKG